ncbi:hypothetical protein ACLB2K_050738 [Fragaria x ananassa]
MLLLVQVPNAGPKNSTWPRLASPSRLGTRQVETWGYKFNFRKSLTYCIDLAGGGVDLGPGVDLARGVDRVTESAGEVNLAGGVDLARGVDQAAELVSEVNLACGGVSRQGQSSRQQSRSSRRSERQNRFSRRWSRSNNDIDLAGGGVDNRWQNRS